MPSGRATFGVIPDESLVKRKVVVADRFDLDACQVPRRVRDAKAPFRGAVDHMGGACARSCMSACCRNCSSKRGVPPTVDAHGEYLGHHGVVTSPPILDEWIKMPEGIPTIKYHLRGCESCQEFAPPTQRILTARSVPMLAAGWNFHFEAHA